MNVVALVFGILLVATGFVTLVWKVHDRSMHESFALMRSARGNAGVALAGFLSLMAPIVSSIATGLVFLAVGFLDR